MSQNAVPSKPVAAKPRSGELTRAAARSDFATVDNLLKQGADINEATGSEPEKLTPLLAALALGQEEMAIHLLNQGASNSPSFLGFFPREFARKIYGAGSKITLALAQSEVGR